MLPTSVCVRMRCSADFACPIFSKILGPTNAMMPASRMKTMTISRIVNPRLERGNDVFRIDDLC